MKKTSLRWLTIGLLDAQPWSEKKRGGSYCELVSANWSVESGTGLVEKNQAASVEHKRQLIDATHTQISIGRQCELLGLARSSYYYQPVPISEENLVLMRLLDEQYTRTAFYGTRRMMGWLNQQGFGVDRKRVQRH